MVCVVYNAARLWYWSLHVKMWKLLHQMLYVTFIVLIVICEVLFNKLFKSIWISVFPWTEMKRVYMYILMYTISQCFNPQQNKTLLLSTEICGSMVTFIEGLLHLTFYLCYQLDKFLQTVSNKTTINIINTCMYILQLHEKYVHIWHNMDSLLKDAFVELMVNNVVQGHRKGYGQKMMTKTVLPVILAICIF